jgi:polyhydroxyalkanoate synthesis regulator protein
MPRPDVESVLSRLRQMSEEGISSLFGEAMTNPRLRTSVGRAGEQFMANKASFDRNVETMLDFVNIPSKKDVRDLKQRLDHLSSQLLNLNLKLDRLLADLDKSPPRVPAPRRGAKKR